MRRAFIADLDGTLIDSFADSPGGMNVLIAYQYSVEYLFGTNALSTYMEQGGLRNRAPREVIIDLYQTIGEGLFDGMFKRSAELEVEAVWGDAKVTFADGGIAIATEMLVRRKLGFLLEHIGSRFSDGTVWPRLMPGVADLWGRVSSDPSLVTLLISSGHNEFIEKTFAVHGLMLPDAMVTDDNLRRLPTPVAKPNPVVFGLGMFMLQAEFGEVVPIGYYGDDSDKDGQLARNAGVPFFHFDLSGKSKEKFRFSNWEHAPVPCNLIG